MKNTISKLSRFLLIVFLLASALAIPPGPARASGAATFTVTSNSDADNALDGFCTLREAISAAVGDANYHGCSNTGAGFGDDLIIFSISGGSSTITLTADLPSISTGILTIDGSNSGSPVVIDGGSSYRPFNIYSSVSLTLKNLTVQHSYFAGYGGAAYNAGTLNVFNSSFLNNLATFEGGAIENDGTVTIANSTFSGNSAPYGGALQNTSGTATILNSTFSGNTASGHGGALGTWDGGGTSANTTVKNTIMANSTAIEDCFNAWASLPGILTGDHNIIETAGSGSATCSGITTSAADPMLGSLTGSPAYFPLSAGSPAMDAGNDAICPAAPVNNESQNGVTRPQGAHCDIGSYEVDFPPTVKSITLLDPNPTSKLSVRFAVTFSEAVTDVAAADFSLTKTGVIAGASVTGVSGTGATRTVSVNTGKRNGTLRLDIPTTATITDLTGNPLSGLPFLGQTYTVKKILTVRSTGSQDGWILESSENSSAGGTLNATNATFNLGDNAAKKQYRDILSFNTSGLPDTAVITSVTLKIKKSAVVGGGNPVTMFQGFMLDIKKGFFGSSAALQISDFQAAASKTGLGPFSPTPSGTLYTITVPPAAYPYINRLATNGGLTQLRLRFKLDDNNNLIANFISFDSGNAPAAYRPILTITFHVP